MGDVLVDQGKLDACQGSCDIRERLARQNPTNAGWQRDLSVSHMKLATVLAKRGDTQGALAALEAARAISELPVALDASNAVWRNDLAWIQEQITAIRENRRKR